MYIKKMIIGAVVMLCGLTGVSFAQGNSFSAAVERAVMKRYVAQQQKKKTFQPGLSEQQVKALPGMMQQVVERLHQAGYTSLGAADVVEGLKMYFELINFSEGIYTSADIEHFMGEKVQATRGDDYQHAMMYALVKMFPQDAKVLQYNHADYPAVTDWGDFHQLCQMYMDEIFRTMQTLQTGEWEEVKEILGNIM